MFTKDSDQAQAQNLLNAERSRQNFENHYTAVRHSNDINAWRQAYAQMEHNRNEFRDAYNDILPEYQQLKADLEEAKQTIKKYDELIGDYAVSMMSHRIRVEKLVKVLNHFFKMFKENNISFPRPWDNPNRIYAAVIQNTNKDLKALREQRSIGHGAKTRYANTYSFAGFDKQINKLEGLFRKYAVRASQDDMTVIVPSSVDIYVNKNLATEDYPDNPNDVIPPVSGPIDQLK